ncbi:hypothetical protein GCM10009775_35800 [Microbacterium aoyamense]|uniref:Uncharacterized protein n=1 Tax=Microbacterium aoyamense TaxID=344166 RepID=A0ABN2Q0S2_9MICO|nr:hypothetical protein [Microbacterium aoyamense]
MTQVLLVPQWAVAETDDEKVTRSRLPRTGCRLRDRLSKSDGDEGFAERELIATSAALRLKYQAMQLSIICAGVAGAALAVVAFRLV